MQPDAFPRLRQIADRQRQEREAKAAAQQQAPAIAPPDPVFTVPAPAVQPTGQPPAQLSGGPMVQPQRTNDPYPVAVQPPAEAPQPAEQFPRIAKVAEQKRQAPATQTAPEPPVNREDAMPVGELSQDVTNAAALASPDGWGKATAKAGAQALVGIPRSMGGMIRGLGEQAVIERDEILDALARVTDDIDRSGDGWVNSIKKAPVFRWFSKTLAMGRLSNAVSNGEVSPEVSDAILKGDWQRTKALLSTEKHWTNESLLELAANKTLAPAGKFIFDNLQRVTEGLEPNVKPRTPRWYVTKAISGVGQTMIPAAVATMVTKRPEAGMMMIFPQVYGDSYGMSRQAGMSPSQAQNKALFDAVTETLSEQIPLGILTKKFRPKKEKNISKVATGNLLN
jgi:hypothetical protein